MSQSPDVTGRTTPLALKRKAEKPYPQAGEATAQKTLSYARSVQPVWDNHCIRCHNSADSPGHLNLSGHETRLFNASYESLVPERRTKRFDRKVLGPVIGENHPKTGNIHYLPAKSLGSYASVLVAMLSPDMRLPDPEAQARAERLAGIHEKIRLSPEELLQVTNWVDTNCQYYGSYYGRRDTIFRGHPDYRTEYDIATAISPDPPATYE
jgi:hypothetical protein